MKMIHGALLAMILTACSSPPLLPASSAEATKSDKGVGMLDGLSNMKDKALELVGLKKPELPDMPESAMPDWQVNWQLNASTSLNVTPSGQALATVVRIYKLRSANAFLQTPYEVFGDIAQEKAAFGEDLIEIKEWRVLPGQIERTKTKVAREGRYVAIVALYRHPASQRWRYVFQTDEAARSGLSIGLHACAMSVPQGTPVGVPAELARSVAMSCP